jgi:hypothetical protein
LPGLDRAKRLRVLRGLKDTYTIYPLDEKVAMEYCELYYELRNRVQINT